MANKAGKVLLGVLGGLAAVFVAREVTASVLPGPGGGFQDLPPDIRQREAVPVLVVGRGDPPPPFGSIQPLVAVSVITPVLATKEVYEAIAGRELTPEELAQMPSLVQYPNGVIGTLA